MTYLITQSIRTNIFDIFRLQKVAWHGNLDDVKFLSRIFDLTNLASNDPRHTNAEEDIARHRIMNNDWETDWIFTDKRFNLMNCDDEIFLKFLCQTLHPVVRIDLRETIKIKNALNTQLASSDYNIYEDSSIDGKPIFNFKKNSYKPKMKIFVISTRTKSLPAFDFYPCFVLMVDGWNDFTYQTMFDAYYFNKEKVKLDLDQIKILQKNTNCTEVKNNIERLSSDYISLGQNLKYYESLARLPQNEYELILDSLNDVVFDRRKLLEFKDNPGWKQSLLRFSEAEKAYEEAGKLYGKEYTEFSKATQFTFKTKMEGFNEVLAIDFDFEKNSIPYRINVIIGKNGSGKTQLQANLANALSGILKGKERFGSFYPNKPLFSKIIAISYSVFDKFELPRKSNTFSYVFCGIRSIQSVIKADGTEKEVERILQRIELKELYTTAIHKIIEKDRADIWKNVTEQLLENDGDVNIDNYVEIFDKSSSGEALLLNIFSNVIAQIENQSLLLIDEPELHLHPNAISNFTRMLLLLLNEFNSYSIVTTHAPVIVQETPSKYITVLVKSETIPIAKKLDIESFGENLSVITNEIFQTNVGPANYKDIIDKLSKTYTYEEVLKLFNDDLSFNAKVYLKTAYQKQ